MYSSSLAIYYILCFYGANFVVCDPNCYDDSEEDEVCAQLQSDTL